MRSLQTNPNDHTQIGVLDEPGAGGACHRYVVVRKRELKSQPQEPLTQVTFQEGPIKESGVNGCQQEDLLAIVVDRLEHFQKGPFPCEQNERALTLVRNALNVLQACTRERQQRGVEGSNNA